MMTAKEAAAALDGNEYREEGSKALFAEMRIAGLVAVFGGSDDLMEFRGAIDDEVGAPGTALVDGIGLLPARSDIDDDGELEAFFKRKPNAAKIKSLFGVDGFTFRYKTTIPHETFVIVEDGDTYCEGIVFALADAHV